MSKLISIVIPCYGSAQTIGSVLAEIEMVFEKNLKYDYEVICVNDASPDEVLEVLIPLSLKNNRITIIDLAKNFGQHAALLAGYKQAQGEIVVSLDDDGQTPANEMFKLIHQIEAGDDVVYAQYTNKKHSFFRNFGSWFNDQMAAILIGKPRNLYPSSYFAMRVFVKDELIRYTNPYPYLLGLVLRTTSRISNVPIPHQSRSIGESTYTLKKLLKLWLNGFTAFSIKPLRTAVVVGLCFAFLGFGITLYAVSNKFLNPDAPLGWTSLMAFQSILGGIILIMLGMIGEYIGRIYISLNNAPQSVIRPKE